MSMASAAFTAVAVVLILGNKRMQAGYPAQEGA